MAGWVLLPGRAQGWKETFFFYFLNFEQQRQVRERCQAFVFLHQAQLGTHQVLDKDPKAERALARARAGCLATCVLIEGLSTRWVLVSSSANVGTSEAFVEGKVTS